MFNNLFGGLEIYDSRFFSASFKVPLAVLK